MSTEGSDKPRRYEIAPDPAWDWYEEEDGVLVVELSWAPDPFAGRTTELVAGPDFVSLMAAEGLTGYRTGPARGYYDEQAVEAEAGQNPPPLVRIIVGADPAADFSYAQSEGLVVSERALALLRAHCENLLVKPCGQ
jgi:hypothetical protein